ncbi:MAG TPA: hypothetical protein V6C52_05220 [Coleofasciculaceae cyanobacterium]
MNRIRPTAHPPQFGAKIVLDDSLKKVQVGDGNTTSPLDKIIQNALNDTSLQSPSWRKTLRKIGNNKTDRIVVKAHPMGVWNKGEGDQGDWYRLEADLYRGKQNLTPGRTWNKEYPHVPIWEKDSSPESTNAQINQFFRNQVKRFADELLGKNTQAPLSPQAREDAYDRIKSRHISTHLDQNA